MIKRCDFMGILLFNNNLEKKCIFLAESAKNAKIRLFTKKMITLRKVVSFA